jgi:Divergent InlB B-repeat domain
MRRLLQACAWRALAGLLPLALAACGGGGTGADGERLLLTVAVSGAGLVESQPAGIVCGTGCSASFTPGTAVTLNANAGIAARFAGWGGACSGTASSCTVSMSAARSVTASFAALPQPAPWTPATVISAGGADRPRIALDAAGNATAVWLQRESPSVARTSVWSSRRPAGGNWSTPERLDSGLNDVYLAEVAVDAASGQAFAMWAEDRPLLGAYAVWVRASGATGAWDSAWRIDQTGRQAANLRIGVDASGRVVTTWNQIEATSTWTVWASRFAPGAGWGAARRLAQDGAQDLRPQLAVAGNGDAFVVWTRQGSGVWASRSTPDGNWLAATQLADGLVGVNLDHPRVAATANGQAMAVWSRGLVANGVFSTQLVAKRFANGAWSDTLLSVAPAVVSDLLSEPVVSADTGGDYAVAWGLADGRVLSAQYSAGTWQEPETARRAGSELRGVPGLGLDSQGDMVGIWAAVNPTSGGTELSVNRFSRAGGWAGASLHDSPPHGSAQPRIAMNPRGDIVTAWVQTQSAGSQIVSRSYASGR